MGLGSGGATLNEEISQWLDANGIEYELGGDTMQYKTWKF